jgi:hypothetical protein
MVDPFVLLAPVLLLGVVALLQFVGCNELFGLGPTVLTEPDQVDLIQLAEKEEILNNDRVTATFAASVDAGHLFVVWIWYNSAAQTVATVVDTTGNAYQRAVGPTAGQGAMAGWQQEIWYAANLGGGSNLDVTATFTGTFNARKALSVHDYRGGAQESPVAQTAANVGNTSDATTDERPVSAGNLVFGAGLFQGTGTSGTEFRRRSSLQNNVTEDIQVLQAGSKAATFVNPPQDWVAQMVVFRARNIANQ